jgi:hypothetical protein
LGSKPQRSILKKRLDDLLEGSPFWTITGADSIICSTLDFTATR